MQSGGIFYPVKLKDFKSLYSALLYVYSKLTVIQKSLIFCDAVLL